MPTLCTNRPEGLGPTSQISSPLPTQCFFDVVLAPLPTWTYMLSLGILFILSQLLIISGRPAPPPPSSSSNNGDDDDHHPPARSRKARLLAAGYYFLIAVVLLMESIEIARLALAGLGVGLLSFIYAGCLLAVLARCSSSSSSLLSCRPRRRGGCNMQAINPHWLRAANLVYWLFGAAVTAVKAAALARYGLGGGGEGDNNPLARTGTPYPVSDQFTDLLVLVVFYAILAAYELLPVALKAAAASSQPPGSKRGPDGMWEEDAEAVRLDGSAGTQHASLALK